MSLARSLQEILDDDLVALWVYGAATFPDRPARLGDVDTHAVLASEPNPGVTKRIDQTHAEIARDYAIEWDSWYVLVNDARSSMPPRHAFRDITDRAWALHRATWALQSLPGLWRLSDNFVPFVTFVHERLR